MPNLKQPQMMRLVLFCFTSMIHNIAFAQSYNDIANLNYQYLKINSDDFDQKAFETSLKIKLPIKLNEDKDYLIFGGRLNHFQYSNSLIADTKTKLSITEGDITYFNLLKGGWSFMVQANGGIYSDFVKVEGNHWQYGGIGLCNYRVSKNLRFSLGVFYHIEAYGPFVIPLGGIEWKANERLFIYALLPHLVIAEYKLDKRFYIGGEVNFIAETYKISQTATNKTVDYLSDHSDRLPTSYLEFNAFADFYLTEKIVIYLKPGLSYLRRLALYDEAEQLIDSANIPHGKFNLSPFIKFGAAYRFRKS